MKKYLLRLWYGLLAISPILIVLTVKCGFLGALLYIGILVLVVLMMLWAAYKFNETFTND